MQKLIGSDDLILVSICMTLTDRDEIRQYLTAYLGSTPPVNNFATEFIKHKDYAITGAMRNRKQQGDPRRDGRRRVGSDKIFNVSYIFVVFQPETDIYLS